ncbi:MAG: sel1 repeat family protein [Colwellia sp.]|nr:sel1 repeat family protein [Colwellia sp.]
MFSWFKSTKNNNKEDIQLELNRFEQYNEKQQCRLDQANQALITSLNQAQLNQSSLQDKQIDQLKNDVEYYRQQITKQQTTIEQLSGRFDAVMGRLLEEKRKDIKEVFSNDDFVRVQPRDLIAAGIAHKQDDVDDVIQSSIASIEDIPVAECNIQNSTEANTEDNVNSDELITKANVASDFKEDDLLFDQAILQRQTGESEQAFLLFEQAAKQGHIKAMGAMGRSFFLGEGTQENHPLGLAWLINAANHNLPQALDRVKHFQDSDPDLYQEALGLSSQLA